MNTTTTTNVPAGLASRVLKEGITCHAIYHAGQVQLIKRLYQE